MTALESFYENIYPLRSISSTVSLETSDPFLDADFSCDEIRAVLNRLKSGKSPGPDGIPNEFYHWVPSNWVVFLTGFLNKVFREGVVPSGWCTSDMILLYKKGDPTDPLNYRGIPLTSVISKIFTVLISSRFSTWCDQNNVIPECQGGFRDHRSCEDNVFNLQARVCLELSKPKGKLYAAFVNFRRAFDSLYTLYCGTLCTELE